MSFSNKVVLVTGASSGIGAATAILFAKEGANVAIVGRNQTKLTKISEECEKHGKMPLVINADVSKDEEAENIIKQTVEKYGRLDVLVNSAGISKFGSILDGKIVPVYDEVMNTNLRAIINLTTLSAPYLVESKGNVVNISSTGAELVPKVPQFIPYCVSKAALEHFTRGAALELSSSGVRVNVVRPGPVRTDMIENSGFPGTWDTFKAGTALDRVSEPMEIAELVLFLASEKAKGITGSVFTSDNGYLLKN
ncbi:A-factor type gamma-butyrolactone 1'-reductase (1S-forming)-like [Pectinophora gossypiella]|uniref:A-factor type gamma-butyrolactone 1'-reductase (1S-forming)-like n=1 Tax=Pectinophora gossypiella TaxID=13191 RepID=UPI00214F076E|nr:A-factor type gamma-butyrolactone 1'-reductase (1S-forming)-like [Pectinophora gossypiella]